MVNSKAARVFTCLYGLALPSSAWIVFRQPVRERLGLRALTSTAKIGKRCISQFIRNVGSRGRVIALIFCGVRLGLNLLGHTRVGFIWALYHFSNALVFKGVRQVLLAALRVLPLAVKFGGP